MFILYVYESQRFHCSAGLKHTSAVCGVVLSGRIPSEVERLSKLQHFELEDNNRLTGSCTLFRTCTIVLTSMNTPIDILSDSVVDVGPIPKELTRLTDLFQLFLSDNSLSGSYNMCRTTRFDSLRKRFCSLFWLLQKHRSAILRRI